MANYSTTTTQNSIQGLIKSLETRRVNTLTELCRIERVAAECEDEQDMIAFQQPMTDAWRHYVTSNQLLIELRGLTPNYPFNGDVVTDALSLVQHDPESNRSWNLAYLCLCKIRDAGLIPTHAQIDSWRPEMWGGRSPSHEEADQLSACFVYEWAQAVESMLQHWVIPPTCY
ncbi:uncharacterized protein B0I36DRAFT_62841 [Microdochium trichocladiopsis]|uniref:Uncharacterized protein n=1 Tax=Microdochium trichocladiopsis TaxID=1682393 RepID=A0A9P8YE40_9PEZI|nr:uncharacterized protein B0I36DRAFT_62841 [Microdochium trichocladiopsis]KAH7037202.1 hypothetical protein B0I36DRAFT_62841 [Microdochium trichocladiopsis]